MGRTEVVGIFPNEDANSATAMTCRQSHHAAGYDLVENGGRTRDRTLDLSRVKGTLSR